jgi:hypothetical protein
MGDIYAYLYIALGVFLAVLYPLLWGWFREAFPKPEGVKISPQVMRYIKLFAFCFVTAFIVLLIYRSSHPDAKLGFYAAVSLGFGWESSVEKIFSPPKRPAPRGGGGGAQT